MEEEVLRVEGDEELEELAFPEPRNSKRVADRKAKGKAIVVYTKRSMKQREVEKPELPQLDDVPRKK